MQTDKLRFPSGRSVANCKKDAKRLCKTDRIPLHEALDRVAADNGLAMPFHRAIAQLKKQAATSLMTRTDIQAVMDRHPELTHFGLGLSQRAVSKMTFDEYRIAFEQERQSLLDAVDECNRACRFMRHMQKRQTINTASSSYGLKHRAETFGRRMGEANPYVANGALICAALHLGFEFKQGLNGSPNVWFNISNRSAVVQWERLKDRARSLYSYSKAQDHKLAMLERQIGFPKPHQPLIEDGCH